MADESNAYLTFYAPLEDWSARAFMTSVTAAFAAGATHLNVAISSQGGQTRAGFTLYNFLRPLGEKLTFYNFGHVDSAAVTMFLAADRRVASPISTFLVHRPTHSLPPSAEFTADVLALHAEQLRHDERHLGKIFLERAPLVGDSFAAFVVTGRSILPTEALSLGIVHQIELFAPPPGMAKSMIDS